MVSFLTQILNTGVLYCGVVYIVVKANKVNKKRKKFINIKFKNFDDFIFGFF
jgi:hypothetical protein